MRLSIMSFTAYLSLFYRISMLHGSTIQQGRENKNKQLKQLNLIIIIIIIIIINIFNVA